MLINNKYSILSLDLTIPLSGAWLARIEADTDGIDLSGQVTLSIGSRSIVGTIASGGISATDGNRLIVDIVAGNGKLSKPLSKAYYHNAPLILPLREALSEAGEVPLSDMVTSNTIFTNSFPRFCIAKGQSLSSLLDSVASQTGTIWSISIEGKSIILDAPKYLDCGLASNQYVMISDDNCADYFTLALDDEDILALLPGQSLNGKAINCVQYVMMGNKLRTKVYY